jgi:hypothetical protein
MAEDDPDLLMADTQAPMAASFAATAIDDITVHAITANGKQGAVMTSPNWDLGGSVRPVIAMLVAEVKALRQRVADLEAS